MRRGGFGNVNRGDDRCYTDTHTANHAPGDEVVDGEREAGTDGADKEKDGRCEHATYTSKLICQAAGEICTDSCADQCKGNCKTELHVVAVEVALKRNVCAVNHGRVKTE